MISFGRSSIIKGGMVNANLAQSSGCNGIEKKQSLTSSIAMCQVIGTAERLGRRGWRVPILCVIRLMALRSCRSPHFPSPCFYYKHCGIVGTEGRFSMFQVELFLNKVV